jgi:hypothetical protein
VGAPEDRELFAPPPHTPGVELVPPFAPRLLLTPHEASSIALPNPRGHTVQLRFTPEAAAECADRRLRLDPDRLELVDAQDCRIPLHGGRQFVADFGVPLLDGAFYRYNDVRSPQLFVPAAIEVSLLRGRMVATPEGVQEDLLPDFFSTRLAELLAEPISEACSARMAPRWKALVEGSARARELIAGEPLLLPNAKALLGRLQRLPSTSLNPFAVGAFEAESDWTEAQSKIRSWRAEGRRLDATLLCDLNGLHCAHGTQSEPAGQWRTKCIAAGGMFHLTYLPPPAIPEAMEALFAQLEVDRAEGAHPILAAARFYQRLLSIHPFSDGNGRTAREALNWLLEDAGLLPASFRGDGHNQATFAMDRRVGLAPSERVVEAVTAAVEETLDVYRRYLGD